MPDRVIEQHTVLDRTFSVTIEGPDSLRRFTAHVREIATGRALTRNPVRGRSVDEVRDRALQVLHNLVGIERIQEEILAVAAELAPGASVELTEDAHAIRADLVGPWALDASFVVPRDELEEDLDFESLRRRVREHFSAHLTQPT